MAGGSTEQSLRKVLGALKDSTTVGLAKVNSEYKELLNSIREHDERDHGGLGIGPIPPELVEKLDLDIAVVKATNHVECPPKEKHVRTIFAATSASRPRADVAYCIHALAKRIAKTHTWSVALKAMMVIHRTLREGDPTFREELINYSRNRGHVLNLSHFKDDSSPNAWDYSAWVRTYALFLEERLECFRVLKYDVESERSSGHSKTRDLDTVDLLEHLPALQQLLYRLIGCQPEGAALSNFVIQAALGLVLKESFKLYRAINDGIINLVDKFFEMQRHDAIKALDVYKRAGQQAEKLSEFYDVCKGLDLARSFQFPTLEQPPQSFLSTMEEYVKDAPRVTSSSRDTAGNYEDHTVNSRARRAQSADFQDALDCGDVSPSRGPASKENHPSPSNHESSDLLGLDDAAPSDPSALEDSNALALAIVPSGPMVVGPGGHDGNGEVASTRGATGWELALVTNPSSNGSAVNNNKLGGGLDKLTLDSLYEDAYRRSTPPTSLSVTTSAQNPFEAAQIQQGAADPFQASSKYAPPPNVQMATMAHHQAMLMQQQVLGQHQNMGVIPQPVANPFANSPYMSYQYSAGVPPQGLPHAPQFQNTNPFGSPGLL